MAKMLRSSIKAVLVDLSGTLHIEDTAIPGAVAALNRRSPGLDFVLKDGSVKIRFVTNTTKESKHILWQRLVKLGFSLNVDDIFSSLTAARQLIEARKLRPMLLLEPAAMEDYKGITVDDPNAVVIGLAPSKFEYQTLTEAFRLLLSGASLIAIHKGRYYRRKDGLALGPGPFVEALEYGSDKKAEIVGKPEKLFFQQALAPLGCKPEEAVMIGDDVCDDIDGAQKAGIIGILVKTGKYRDGDESKISPAPNYIFDNFPSAVDFILQNINA